MASVILPIAAAVPVSVLVVSLYGVASGTYGHPYLPWLLTIATALLLAASFGYGIGALLGSRWFTTPLAAVLFFGLYVFIQSVGSSFGARSLFPVILNNDTEFASYISETMWGQVGFFASLVAVIFFLCVAQLSRARPLAMAGALVAIFPALLFASTVLSTNGQYLTGHNPRDFTCTDTSPTICLNRGYVAALDPLQERFRVFNEKAQGTDLEVHKLEQNVEGIGDEPAVGARSVYIEGIDPEGLDFALSRYAEKYGGLLNCYESHAPFERMIAVGIIDTWLTGYDSMNLRNIDSATPGYAQWQAFQKLSVTDGNSWLKDNYSAYASCSLDLEKMPK